MDDKYLKYLGTYIIAIVGALFVSIGVLLGELPLKPQWIGFLVIFMGATETLLVAMIRMYFKLPEEEEKVIIENVDLTDWKYVTADTSDGGTVNFWIKTDGTVSWTDPYEEN